LVRGQIEALLLSTNLSFLNEMVLERALQFSNQLTEQFNPPEFL
jgi:hypothetical protein